MTLYASLIIKVLKFGIFETKFHAFYRLELLNSVPFFCRFSHNVKFLVTVEVKEKLQCFIAENHQFSFIYRRFHNKFGKWRRNCKGHTQTRSSCILSHKQMSTRFYTGICGHNLDLTCHCIQYLASNSSLINIHKACFLISFLDSDQTSNVVSASPISCHCYLKGGLT